LRKGRSTPIDTYQSWMVDSGQLRSFWRTRSKGESHELDEIELRQWKVNPIIGNIAYLLPKLGVLVNVVAVLNDFL
jgi:hypothetical protein